ncbi:ATP-binding cassette domain-containing protein [Hathewaya limosa]|uniref:ABC-type multidrug transport system fused ATPase/permease subunit n=1 Tax=Hathewaya limosa TaxID=1536 RepID=A0ABU0JT88_HATLI|nr:ABC transporter ATP-binding protein [Hathewaya limosa]MDQ0480300.1 ABC-type multidrug transport system fused ATPase/permease subunit [Hathewaya limosa]
MKKYISNVKGYIILQYIFEILATLSIAAVPYMQKLLLDKMQKGNNVQNSFIHIIFVVAICIFVYCLCSWLSLRYTILRINKMREHMQKDLFNSFSKMGYNIFKKKDIGEYISMQNTDIAILIGDYFQPLIDLFRPISIICIYAFSICFYINWKIAIIMFSMSIVICIIPKLFEKPLAKVRKKHVEQQGRYTSQVKDYLEGFKLINDNTREKIKKQHKSSVCRTSEAIKNFGIFKAFTTLIYDSGTKFMEIIVFLLVGILIIKREISVGTALAIFSYSHCFIGPFEDFLYDITTLNSTKDVKNRFSSYINYINENNLKPTEISKFKDKITMENVCLSYDNFNLNNICCNFKKGKKYAIIGHSGSGKSTMINLLMKYEIPDSGEISIDGCSIASLNIDDIVMCISQQEHIYRESFENNVTVFGSYSHSTFSEVLNKYDNSIIDKIKSKENCSDLSGGEKQLTSFIRSLVSGNDVLIMDEPFSAMDAGTLKKVMDILFELEDKTIIMVTHNLGMNLDKFDEVILMDEGSIVEKGMFHKVRENYVFNHKLAMNK